MLCGVPSAGLCVPVWDEWHGWQSGRPCRGSSGLSLESTSSRRESGQWSATVAFRVQGPTCLLVGAVQPSQAHMPPFFFSTAARKSLRCLRP